MSQKLRLRKLPNKRWARAFRARISLLGVAFVALVTAAGLGVHAHQRLSSVQIAQSSKLLPTARLAVSGVNPAIAGDSTITEPLLANQKGMLYFGGFEGAPWYQTMHADVTAGNHMAIVPGAGVFGSKALRTTYLQGSYGSYASPSGTSSTIFKVPFGSTGANIGAHDDLYFRFMVRFQPGFQFDKSGKLPGLAGGTDNAGGHPPDGYDGWSGRLDWVGNGGIISYLYVPGIQKYGLELTWHPNGQTTQLLKPGQWACLEMRYRMNTPGLNDGIAQGWLNGAVAIDYHNINFRSTTNLAIDNILFTTFFGGATADYASPQTQYADFDSFAVATQYIPCPGT